MANVLQRKQREIKLNISKENIWEKDMTLQFSQFKPSSFVPSLLPGLEWTVVPHIFIADIPVDPSKKSLSFSEFLQQ